MELSEQYGSELRLSEICAEGMLYAAYIFITYFFR